MASISGSFPCSPSLSRRHGSWQIPYHGQGRVLSTSQHQAVFKNLYGVGADSLGLVSCLDYKPIRPPLFSRRSQKNGVMQEGRLLKLCSEVSPAEFSSWWKRNCYALCCSSSKYSNLNGPMNSDSHREGEPNLDFSEENQLLLTSSMSPPQLLDVPVNEERINGRSGFACFYANGAFKKEDESVLSQSSQKTKSQSMLWFAAPLVLVASVVLPPIFLRQLIETVLEDTLATDFVILLFTEAAFYAGAYVFLYITQKFWVIDRQQKPNWSLAAYLQGYKVSSVICLILSVVLPVLSIYIVWPWIGPAAAAALVPYLVGLLVQLGFEEIMKDSPLLPHIQVLFQVYRLHQLNRGAQLAAGLMFTLKGIETTAETMAITGSLQSLMIVIQLLGVLCLWSLSSFLVQASSFQHQTQARA